MRSCSDTDIYSPRVVSQKSDSLRYCWKFKKNFTFNFFLVQFIAQSKGEGGKSMLRTENFTRF